MNKPLFDKILIANRSEIAVRIIRTLKKMGIKSVAVYSEADTNSMYVQHADEAYYIGDSPATESYLSIKNIISAIRESGASAVHPGYGFLSENPNFANILKREGVVLIGPSAGTIKKMGDKIEAKKIAIEAGVSTVPGYMGTINDVKQAIDIAKEIGFPVIVKAAAGGGGRGMRVVNNPAEMANAFESAKLEAANSFSDDRLFIEKLIQTPRHIEIQLIADQYGNSVCLGERECSIQRHHQKVIEEAPSSFITEDIRQEMYRQVISLSQKVGYYSAGTVEFIVDSNKNFYFLEMNTRLQVEHPVTELITGIDIVEEMIQIAAGEKLSFTQDDVKLKGWAFESRICAENPSRGFLPSSGRITAYSEPAKSPNIRIDTGIGLGSEVSMFYDSMIAKLCTYGETREQAIELMHSALSSYIINGIAHNISFLEAVMLHPRFVSGDISTAFIQEEYPDGFSGASLTSEVTTVFLATAIFIYISEQRRASLISGNINNQANKIGTRWVVTIDDKLFPVLITPVENGYNIRHESDRIYIRSNWNLGNELFTAIINGKKTNVKIENIRTGYLLSHAGISVKAFVRSPRISELEALMVSKVVVEESSELQAPLSGQIAAIKVKEGQEVTAGQEIMILTAMKMENLILAERDGKIAKIFVNEKDNVVRGQVLLEFA
ncbi:acetyl-CoA carboxylase [Rickettsia conorii subsp. heilongjiangensis]|uniref:propionyl-CoA carboxylase n=1 Tax=Rickettsia conorii subsp. heilongjiangensis TaxID=226665 RepID=A0AAD1GIU7_RICCR|nr:acetyl/propionyl/methylcrotonyl-CoA carboxylase subunit alpha [Rickettsia conorii]AEK74956.1 acetyl-CoA carboxylase, biotin carboxylase [Rickettsia conorii subsp. heilongjiangensis 054]BBM91689.1 acetyl-CoA carboxylase [Rickettsia conorii subsp. heilongjiangensis]BBM92898.1 acetyl-CoA carboxylase [Rickettsia conorii subsp. heilongjiangensis]BBM94107.1 acetyl-CoA carboxylase [Rickettsia conorii subsp. heilongjiangensis]BBM95316.1 acetyl-CoA carboxylase [Rickettsia conorii subsp. heilongjiang